MRHETTFSLQDISELLHVEPQRLRQWEASFPLVFDDGSDQPKTHYSQGDLATLLIIQRFFENGYSPEQITQHLNGHRPESAAYVKPPAAEAHHADLPHPHEASVEQTLLNASSSAPEPSDLESSASAPSVNAIALDGDTPYLPERISAASTLQPLNDMLGDMLGSVANSQQSMLNIQDSIREMLGVIVQDNFNLKAENRKLRDRMLEVERTLAEYQRREETRKERLEGRLRAVESTLSAMQQQLTQLVQLQRQKSKRSRFW